MRSATTRPGSEEGGSSLNLKKTEGSIVVLQTNAFLIILSFPGWPEINL